MLIYSKERLPNRRQIKLSYSVPHVIVDSGSNIAGRLIPKLPLVGSH